MKNIIEVKLYKEEVSQFMREVNPENALARVWYSCYLEWSKKRKHIPCREAIFFLILPKIGYVKIRTSAGSTYMKKGVDPQIERFYAQTSKPVPPPEELYSEYVLWCSKNNEVCKEFDFFFRNTNTLVKREPWFVPPVKNIPVKDIPFKPYIRSEIKEKKQDPCRISIKYEFIRRVEERHRMSEYWITLPAPQNINPVEDPDLYKRFTRFYNIIGSEYKKTLSLLILFCEKNNILYKGEEDFLEYISSKGLTIEKAPPGKEYRVADDFSICKGEPGVEYIENEREVYSLGPGLEAFPHTWNALEKIYEM
jgi:hypothetical protein